jgi:hypothetical protein
VTAESQEKTWHETHKERHKMLHESLDELAADFIGITGKRLGETTVMELIQWSYQQTLNPTESGRK